MNPFENGVVVVTGGGSGIGAALARACAQRGAKVAVSDIDFAAAEATTQAIRGSGGEARAYRTDVTSAESLAGLSRDVERDLGLPTLVFANAGVACPGTVAETSLANFAWLFAVNVTGVIQTIQTFLPALQRQADQGKPARMVMTGSENSLGLPDMGASSGYTATKHTILGLSDALRRDLAGTGVGVTIFCPGLVATQLADSARARPAEYGGPKRLAPDRVAAIEAMMRARAQDPNLTAQLVCEGIERGDFMIITHSEIRALVDIRQREIYAALDQVDRRLVQPA